VCSSRAGPDRNGHSTTPAAESRGLTRTRPDQFTGDYGGISVGYLETAGRVGRLRRQEDRMGIGVSLFLIALGAVVAFATDLSLAG
jgi:hypothetical protein